MALPAPSPAADDSVLLDAYSASVADTVDRIGPAVCRIERVAAPDRREAGGHGSGFVIAPDGLVVTNFHVVGDARTVRVSMPDGASSEGRVLGRGLVAYDSVEAALIIGHPSTRIPDVLNYPGRAWMVHRDDLALF